MSSSNSCPNCGEEVVFTFTIFPAVTYRCPKCGKWAEGRKYTKGGKKNG